MDDGSRGSKAPSESVVAFGVNAGIVDDIRRRYELDPSSVDASWADWFETPRSNGQAGRNGRDRARAAGVEDSAKLSELGAKLADRHARALQLIHAYRSRGHRIADLV